MPVFIFFGKDCGRKTENFRINIHSGRDNKNDPASLSESSEAGPGFITMKKKFHHDKNIFLS